MRSRTCSIAIVFAVLSACGEQEVPAVPPPAVEYTEVGASEIATEFEFVARTRAREDTEIRARITGTILERNFEEGQTVEKDALLFRIDPRPYEAALSSARAELTRARTSLQVAERNAKRAEELAPDGYISDAELDQLTGERDSANAAVEAAQAAVENAEINMDFTEVRAPFAGTAGRSNLSIGDLVDPSAGALVSIVQLDPMLADFDVDEETLAQALKENQQRQSQGLDPIHYTLRLELITGDIYPHEGHIDYANNRINPSTGTVTVTARFPNPDGLLLPGQFGRVHVQRGEPEMQLTVPQPAVLEDMQGRYVFVILDDETVARRNVRLGQRVGVDWVVLDGLDSGDKVIVNGVQKVRTGMPVQGAPVDEQLAPDVD